jgi:hypothetical protein
MQQRGGREVKAKSDLGFGETSAARMPRLLMLSHCVPATTGAARRTRAWQLLNMAGRSYQVMLATVYDGPIHLDQWRAAAACATEMVLVPRQPVRQLIGRAMRLLSRRSSDRTPMCGALDQTVTTWAERFRIDALLCTHPDLWRRARYLKPALGICDMSGRSLQRDPNLAVQCHYLIVADSAEAAAVRKAGRRPLIVAPDVPHEALPALHRLESTVRPIKIAQPQGRDTTDAPPLARAA